MCCWVDERFWKWCCRSHGTVRDHGDPLGQTPRQKLQQNQDLPMPPSGTKDTAIQAETAANEQKSASTIFETLFICGTVPGPWLPVVVFRWGRLHHKQFFKGMACKTHSIINSTPSIPITSYKFKSEFEVILIIAISEWPIGFITYINYNCNNESKIDNLGLYQ